MASGRYFHCARRGCSASKTYVVMRNAFQASSLLTAVGESRRRGGAPASLWVWSGDQFLLGDCGGLGLGVADDQGGQDRRGHDGDRADGERGRHRGGVGL